MVSFASLSKFGHGRGFEFRTHLQATSREASAREASHSITSDCRHAIALSPILIGRGNFPSPIRR